MGVGVLTGATLALNYQIHSSLQTQLHHQLGLGLWDRGLIPVPVRPLERSSPALELHLLDN